MKNRIISLILTMLIVIGLLPTSALAEEIKSEDIVILYENDVHCVVEGYSKLSAMKKELNEKKLLNDYKPIKEVNGHTPMEVIFGCILGIVVGLAFSLL